MSVDVVHFLLSLSLTNLACHIYIYILDPCVVATWVESCKPPRLACPVGWCHEVSLIF